MITDLHFKFVEDVSKRNTALLMPAISGCCLSAAVLLAPSHGSVAETRFACLQHVVTEVSTRMPTYRFWLLAGHSAPQPDNRITRYYKLWKALSVRGINIPAGEYLGEFIQEADNSLKFFGAVRFNLAELDRVYEVIVGEHVSHVVAIQESSDDLLPSILAQGWTRPTLRGNPSQVILNTLCPRAGVVLGVYGEFDDPEVAVAVIGMRDVICRLNQ